MCRNDPGLNGGYFCIQLALQPIHFAARNGQDEVIELLVDVYGIDPGMLNEVNTFIIIILII